MICLNTLNSNLVLFRRPLCCLFVAKLSNKRMRLCVCNRCNLQWTWVNETQKSMKANVFRTVQSWDKRSTLLCTSTSSMALAEPLGKYHANTYSKMPFTSVFNLHPDWNSLEFPGYKKRTNKSQMWACCLKCVYEQSDRPRAEHWEEFPLRLGCLNDHSSVEDECQKSLWA